MTNASLYELLAEEATELAHAALKKARILRGENPTPMFEHEADEYLLEEYSDVVLCARIIDLYPDEGKIKLKQLRWSRRLSENG